MKIFFLIITFALSALAGNRSLVTVEGTITDTSTPPVPVTSSIVIFAAQIYSPSGCLLWQETLSSIDMSSSNGGFVVAIGAGTNTAAGALSWNQVFQNGISLGAGALTGSGCAGSYQGSAQDDRTLYLSFTASNPAIATQSIPAISLKANSQNAMVGGYSFTWNGTAPATGQVMTFDATNGFWYPSTVSSSGLTSVNLNLPTSLFVNPGSIAANGTYSWTLQNQSPLQVLAGPSSAGSPASAPIFRSLVAADIPSLPATIIGSGTLGIANGGTGASTVASAISNLLPSQSGHTGKVLSTDGTGNLSWITSATGSVTSVSSANSYISVSGGSVAAVVTANVGTTANTLAAGDDSRITTAFKNGGNSFGSAASLGTSDANSLTIKTNGSTAVTVDTNSRVGIGTTTPSYLLDVNGDVNIGSTSNFLRINGNRFLSMPDTTSVGVGYQSLNAQTIGATKYNTGIGYQALRANTTGSGSTAVGHSALASVTTGSSHTAIGYKALSATTASSSNTAVGYSSLMVNTTGDFNVALGASSMQANTIGANNVAMGYSASGANTSGSNNVAIGSLALASNQDGNQNIAIGISALGSTVSSAVNLAIGPYALYSNTTGTANAGLGYGSLNINTTGSYNTALGYDTFRQNTSGSYNTALGYSSGYNSTGNYNVYLGSGAGTAVTFGNSNILIGYQAASTLTTGTNNIVIGTSASVPSSTTNNFLNIGGLLFGDLTNGRIGVGVTSPSYKLDVGGDLNASGCLRASGGVIGGTCSSDVRLKEDVHAFTTGLETLLKINLYTYKFNGLGETPKSEEPTVGVMAQEIEKISPDLIRKKMVKLRPQDSQMTEIKAVEYSKFPYIVMNAVKDLYGLWHRDHHDLEALKLDNANLRKKNEAIMAYLCQKEPQAAFCQQ